MERPVIILQSLLVLLAIFDVAAVCLPCKLDANLDIVCNSFLTVLRARAFKKTMDLTAEQVDDKTITATLVSARYEMKLEKTFKSGRNQIEESNPIFELLSSSIDGSWCGFDFRSGADYLLAGIVDEKGGFINSFCNPTLWEAVPEPAKEILQKEKWFCANQQ